MFGEKQKVCTFATLSRGKRTKEYDILKNIVKYIFSIASKNVFEKKLQKYLEVWKTCLNFANAFSEKRATQKRVLWKILDKQTEM